MYKTEHCRSITKFRLSTHNLNIETGRHKKLELDKSPCFKCTSEIGDEVHMLIKCPLYQKLRTECKKSKTLSILTIPTCLIPLFLPKIPPYRKP